MKIASIRDFREAARRRLPRLLFDYLDGGSYAELTLARNVEDFASLALRQRVMRDVSNLSLATEWFGIKSTMPVAMGPIGFSGMFARRGETQAARAAQAAGIPYSLSTLGICSAKEVARAATPPWYQLYMIKDRGFMSDLLARVKQLGCPVLLFTVDLPVAGTRYRDTHSGMSSQGDLATELYRIWQGVTHQDWLWDVQFLGGPHSFGNLVEGVKDATGLGQFASWVVNNLDPTLTWKDLAWIRERWDGPIVIKGVLDPEDAKQALAAGVNGVLVSNHGGRQLDGAHSGARALPGVLDAVGGQTTVFVDGGIRSGLDVLRALALGADGAFIGRAWAYALAAGGQKGVAKALAIIRAELVTAMSLTGCTDVRKAGRDLLA